jgi:hypothetical protein
MSTIQPHSWCHVGDDNLTRVMLRSVNNRDGRSKVATIHTTTGTVPPPMPPQGTIRQPPRSGFPRARPYPFLCQPLSLRTDRASSTAGQQRNDAHTSTTGDRTPATGARVFHRPITDVTATPQGWPAFTRARRYSNLYSTSCAFSSKAPP